VRVDRELETEFFALIDLLVEGRGDGHRRLLRGGMVAGRPRWLGRVRNVRLRVAALGYFDGVKLLRGLLRGWRLPCSLLWLSLLSMTSVAHSQKPDGTCAKREFGNC
jgi:hypothetical protein